MADVHCSHELFLVLVVCLAPHSWESRVSEALLRVSYPLCECMGALLLCEGPEGRKEKDVQCLVLFKVCEVRFVSCNGDQSHLH